MKTCMNILVSIWPLTAAPKSFGARHTGSSRGSVFNLGLSRSYRGQKPEAIMDRLTVSG